MKKNEKCMGREKRVCSSCSREFSTHSQERKHCYNCRPKCTETHYFMVQDIARAKLGLNPPAPMEAYIMSIDYLRAWPRRERDNAPQLPRDPVDKGKEAQIHY